MPDLLTAAKALLDRIDNITTEEFARGGERAEREAMRQAIEPMASRFPIGQQFYTRGKHPKLCTVVDILRTYNAASELVRVRYAAAHDTMGQVVTDYDVCETTIAMGAVQSDAAA